MKKRSILLCSLLMAPSLALAEPAQSTPQTQPAALVRALPACQAEDLSLTFDGEQGMFDGMQHGGTLLVLRNIGAQACRLDRLPKISFENAKGKTLNIVRQPPKGMHPGPVELPIGLAVGAEATTKLYWVRGDAYGDGHCYHSATARVAIGQNSIGDKMQSQFCAPKNKPATFRQAPLALDPVLREDSSSGSNS